MGSNSINVYGYIRVSTEGQVKQGYSLGSNVQKLKNIAVPKVTT